MKEWQRLVSRISSPATGPLLASHPDMSCLIKAGSPEKRSKERKSSIGISGGGCKVEVSVRIRPFIAEYDAECADIEEVNDNSINRLHDSDSTPFCAEQSEEGL